MERSELHPVEVLLLLGLLTVEAVLTVLRLLVLPTLALVVVLLTPRRRRDAPVSMTTPEPPAPALPVTPAPCLSGLAQSLLELPAAQLRELAGTRRRLPNRELTALICAMPI